MRKGLHVNVMKTVLFAKQETIRTSVTYYYFSNNLLHVTAIVANSCKKLKFVNNSLAAMPSLISTKLINSYGIRTAKPQCNTNQHAGRLDCLLKTRRQYSPTPATRLNV